MKSDELLKGFQEAEGSLFDFTRALISMTSPLIESVPRLQATAALLAAFELSPMSSSEKELISKQLLTLQHKASEAELLLRSAAALQFGNFLNSGARSGGYSSDGEFERFGGGGLRIEG